MHHLKSENNKIKNPPIIADRSFLVGFRYLI